MPRLTIDGRTLDVAPGTTVLEAAARLGIRVPTLCHLEGFAPLATCMVCLVEERSRGRLVASCATRAEEGMCIETRSELAHEARRVALELLLSEHAGECRAPCVRACPLGLDVPALLDHVQAHDLEAAWRLLREGVALPATAARLCTGRCERACRRRQLDAPVRVASVHASVAAWGRNVGARRVRSVAARHAVPLQSPGGRRRVAVVGAGPAGLAALDVLLSHGQACTLVDEHGLPAATLRDALGADEQAQSDLSAEVDALVGCGVTLRLGVRVARESEWRALREACDVLVIATGTAPSGIEALGVETRGARVAVTRPEGPTAAAGVFAGGRVVEPSGGPLRSLARGRAVGHAAQRWLSDEPSRASELPRQGESTTDGQARSCALLGPVTLAELEALRVNRARRQGDRGPEQPLGPEIDRLAQEAARCLGCGCRSVSSCALRRLCHEHGVEARRFAGTRRPIEIVEEHSLVRHESGKCLLCGRCVRIAEAASEPLGLTFVGRGFGTRVATPLGRPLAASLERSAMACAQACPTGALTLRDRTGGDLP